MEYSHANNFSAEKIRSQFLIEWLNLLCDTESRYKKFQEMLLDNEDLFHSACKYQRYLRNVEGRGKDIDIDLIQEAADNGDYNTLHKIFQEIFIEPIDNEAIRYFINLTTEKKIVIYDLINNHNYDDERCFWLVLKKTM